MAHELYTSCTACGAVFEITLEQLGLANGAVRCGVCGETFNARESLREGSPELALPEDELPEEAEILAAASPQPIPDEPAPLAEDDLSVDETVIAAVDRSGAWNIGDAFEGLGSPDDPIPGEDASDVEDESLAASGEFDGLLQGPKEGPGLLANLIWGVLGIAMLVVAAAQVAFYWRDQWIQIAWLNAPLLALNERLGAPVEFTYDVERYRFVDRPRLLVDDTAAGAEQGTQVLEVQAELANEASVPQPPPHLRLVLEDRWGRPIASRTLLPRDYLAQSRSPEQFLAPAERVSATARVATRNASPQAYTLDICLPATADRLDCGDPPTKR